MIIDKVISSLLLNVYYKLINRFFLSHRMLPKDNKKKYLVCLTTFHKRIERVYLTIESIFEQDESAAKVVLFLSEDDIPDTGIPKSLSRLESRGLDIIVVNENLKSYKKLSCLNYIYNYTSFEYVVTIDDDIFYPKWFLSKFSEVVNGSSVYCYRGKVVSFDESGKLKDYIDWPLANKVEHRSSSWILPTGVSGVCYPVSVINDDFFDVSSFFLYCPTADDIWYKLCCFSKGVDSRLVLENSTHFTPVIYLNDQSLESINVGQNKNTKQMYNALKYFRLKE